jgi:hypothetical protein
MRGRLIPGKMRGSGRVIELECGICVQPVRPARASRQLDKGRTTGSLPLLASVSSDKLVVCWPKSWLDQ